MFCLSAAVKNPQRQLECSVCLFQNQTSMRSMFCLSVSLQNDYPSSKYSVFLSKKIEVRLRCSVSSVLSKVSVRSYHVLVIWFKCYSELPMFCLSAFARTQNKIMHGILLCSKSSEFLQIDHVSSVKKPTKKLHVLSLRLCQNGLNAAACLASSGSKVIKDCKMFCLYICSKVLSYHMMFCPSFCPKSRETLCMFCLSYPVKYMS
jgi:hypothetical protein